MDGWTLGCMINELNRFSWSDKTASLGHFNSDICLYTVYLVICVACVMRTVQCACALLIAGRIQTQVKEEKSQVTGTGQGLVYYHSHGYFDILSAHDFYPLHRLSCPPV
jgi:hypothetical protein